MTSPVHILGLSGSLRRASWNSALLRVAGELLPEAVTLEIHDLAAIPLFNQDLIDDGHYPEAVTQLKTRLAAADALLIATPEYNYSLPAVLKNALDWASRPVKESPLAEKPLAMMGVGGLYGTVRAQWHLRQVAVFTNMLPLNKPEVMIPRGWEKFDAAGQLTDASVRPQIQALVEALAAWTRRLRGH